MMELPGTRSDDLPAVLATGKTDALIAFVSMSAREPEGRDAEYIEWHSLDHRPEQYRLSGLRGSLRVVSTPACRAARAASTARFDPVDHVMVYLFSGAPCLASFVALGGALAAGGRMPLRLPKVEHGTYHLAGAAARPSAVAGAEVIPWRPARGVYVLVEQGDVSSAELVDVAGVAGTWWYRGFPTPEFSGPTEDLQLTVLYLDADPIETAHLLQPKLERRWSTSTTTPLLAAPFHTVTPYKWDEYLP